MLHSTEVQTGKPEVGNHTNKKKRALPSSLRKADILSCHRGRTGVTRSDYFLVVPSTVLSCSLSKVVVIKVANTPVQKFVRHRPKYPALSIKTKLTVPKRNAIIHIEQFQNHPSIHPFSGPHARITRTNRFALKWCVRVI